MLVDLSTTDLIYPSSCVATSRSYVKTEPVGGEFLRAYVAGIQLIKRDIAFAENFAKWLRESDALIKKSVEAYARIFKIHLTFPTKDRKRDKRPGKSPFGAKGILNWPSFSG
jgi:hypothetical protein